MIDTFKTLSTPAVSDALDRLGINGCCHGIAPLFNEARFVGAAFTVRYEPVTLNKGSVGDFLDDVPQGAVVTIDNAGRTDCTVWGDIMTTLALGRKLAGTLIDGVCRDVDLALERKYPIFSRGRYMRTGKDRVQLAEIGGTATIGGIPVRHGDIIIGDCNGVLVVPTEKARDVAALAQDIDAKEAEIIREIEAGLSLRAAREKHRYHELQRRAD